MRQTSRLRRMPDGARAGRGVACSRASRLAACAVTCAFLGLLLPALAQAAAPIRAEVDRTSIRAGETVRLKLTLTLDARESGQPDVEAPDLSQWQVVGRFERSHVDGMRGTATTVLELVLQPTGPGRLTIAPFTLKLGGRNWRTEPVVVEVHGPAGTPVDQAPRAGPSIAPRNDAFVAWEVDRTAAWLGEGLQATLYIYVNGDLGASQITLADVDLEGFWSQQHTRRAGLSRGEQVQVGDRVFRRQELTRFTLFPIRAGTLRLPAARVDMTLSEQWYLGRGRSQQAQRTADPIAVEVKALPTTGRPDDFAGPAVGEVRLRASLDRTALQADEGVQLTVVTEVDGLLQNVPRVTLPELPGFKVFPPTEDERPAPGEDRVGGTRRSTWLLRPLRAGRLTVPALRIPYFDPASATYREATTTALAVTVRGEPKATAGEPSAGSTPDGRPRGPALRTIRRLESLREEGGAAWRSTLFAAAVALPPLLLLGLVIGERVRSRRASGAGDRAARRAAADARKGLEALAAQAPPEAFAGVSRALITYLEVRFGEPFNGLTHDQVARRLEARGVSPETARALSTELENCDFARFAPAATRTSERDDAVKRAVALVAAVEQQVSP